MNKRIVSLLLSLLLLLSLIASAVLPAFAAKSLTASEDCVAVLKKMEGFSKYPVADYGQNSVGYGTACPEEDLERYKSQGITEKEADKLLRSYLKTMGETINKFAAGNNLTLRQNQFDALLLLTYNIGTSWVVGSSDLKNAILTGATGNDLIYYMARWCTADYQVLPGLVKRRLAEADLFLNGNYSAEAPSYYSYVILDPNGGACTSRVQGYDASDPAALKAVPTRSDYRFLGWYTQKEGGIWITDLDTTTAELTLYARWQKDDGSVDNGVIQGTACAYRRKINSSATLSVYESPNAAKPFAQLNAGINVKIVADYVDSAGAKWGKMEGGGWINLGTTQQMVYPAAKTVTTNITVTVTGTNINVRSGAGTAYQSVGKVYQGDSLVISETQMVGSVRWGRYSGGWICLAYTDYETKTGTSDTSTLVSLTGKVVNCDSLRVRNGPGTNYITVDQIKAGATVEITETKSVGAAVWGKVSNGWVCLSYVQLNEDAVTKPEISEDTGDAQYGTVINCTGLNVRSAAGTGNKLVDRITPGTRVLIYETTSVDGVSWARIKQGWVCMTYIQLDYTGSEEGQTGVVVSTVPLNVRSGAGTSNSKVTTLATGSKVTVYETTKTNGTTWGRVTQGWVCMDYVRLDASTTTVSGTVIATDSLRIRNGAGTKYAQVGNLKYGSKVDIYETVTASNGMQWGRIAQGWISMDYVQLNSESSSTEPIIGTVVDTDTLRIRKGARTTYAQVGTLVRGEQVEIYETLTASNGMQWGRISEGWICMTYIRIGEEKSFTGTVTTESLRIRSAPGTHNEAVGSYNYGTQVEILETSKVGSVTWGKTNQGWISLNYVKY